MQTQKSQSPENLTPRVYKIYDQESQKQGCLLANNLQHKMLFEDIALETALNYF